MLRVGPLRCSAAAHQALRRSNGSSDRRLTRFGPACAGAVTSAHGTGGLLSRAHLGQVDLVPGGASATTGPGRRRDVADRGTRPTGRRGAPAPARCTRWRRCVWCSRPSPGWARRSSRRSTVWRCGPGDFPSCTGAGASSPLRPRARRPRHPCTEPTGPPRPTGRWRPGYGIRHPSRTARWTSSPDPGGAPSTSNSSTARGSALGRTATEVVAPR